MIGVKFIAIVPSSLENVLDNTVAISPSSASQPWSLTIEASTFGRNNKSTVPPLLSLWSSLSIVSFDVSITFSAYVSI